MPLPTQYATVTVNYRSDKKGPFLNVLHYVPIGASSGDQTIADALAADIDNRIGGALKAYMAASASYLGTQVALNNGGVVFNSSDVTSAGVGALGGDTLPDYSAVLIQKRTGVPGRRGRGRWFVGCVPEVSQAEGVITPGGQVTIDGLMTELVANAVAAGETWRPCHLSRANSTLVVIDALTNRTILVTERRRRLRPGF